VLALSYYHLFRMCAQHLSRWWANSVAYFLCAGLSAKTHLSKRTSSACEDFRTDTQALKDIQRDLHRQLSDLPRKHHVSAVARAVERMLEVLEQQMCARVAPWRSAESAAASGEVFKVVKEAVLLFKEDDGAKLLHKLQERLGPCGEACNAQGRDKSESCVKDLAELFAAWWLYVDTSLRPVTVCSKRMQQG
jgi:hypothetical protein